MKERDLDRNSAEDRFVAWLTTQLNSHGSLYLERVARQYARYLRTQPTKLISTLAQDARNVFLCKSVQQFEKMYQVFVASPNYKEVNSQGHQSFSAGLAAYGRYVRYLEANGESEMSGQTKNFGIASAISAPQASVDFEPQLVDFTHPKQSVGGIEPMTIIEEKSPELLGVNSALVPDSVIEVLNKNYAAGFRFDTTYINLLSNASGVEVDMQMQAALKRVMFRRNDDIYFLLDTIADDATRKNMIDFADNYLEEYGCFEMLTLYKLYEDKVNPNFIRNVDDFENFYGQICKSDIRCVQAPYIGNRIVRYNNGAVWTTFREVATKIVAVIADEYYGSCNEDDLHTKFCAFSTDLLGKIIKQCAADELIRVEINGSICYQTFEALGLPENFSDVLAEVLEQVDDIGLELTQNAIHTAISLRLGVNFVAEFNLPDWETFRRLIAVFYKAEPRREWKSNIFGEVLT